MDYKLINELDKNTVIAPGDFLAYSTSASQTWAISASNLFDSAFDNISTFQSGISGSGKIVSTDTSGTGLVGYDYSKYFIIESSTNLKPRIDSTKLSFTSGSITVTESGLAHNSLSGSGVTTHIDHNLVSISASSSNSLVKINGTANSSAKITENVGISLSSASLIGTNGVVAVTDSAIGSVNNLVRDLIYIQAVDEDTTITAGSAVNFFVPSYLYGKVIKTLGIGLGTASTSGSVGVSIGAYASGSIAQTASAIEVTNPGSWGVLPSAITKVPITITYGGTDAKGLDIWLIVGSA